MMKLALILALAVGAFATDKDSLSTEAYERELLDEEGHRELGGFSKKKWCGSEVLTVQQGAFGYLPGYTAETCSYGTCLGYGKVEGRGQLIRKADGTTTGSISLAFESATVAGGTINAEGKTFNSHLHRTSCADGGGQHYQDILQCPYFATGNSCPTATFPGNELWFNGVVEDGRLVVQSDAPWFIPKSTKLDKDCGIQLDGGQSYEDLSIVIHDTPGGTGGSGPKMLCVDLKVVDTTVGETAWAVIPTDFTEAPQLKYFTMKRKGDGTTSAWWKWKDLRRGFTYPSHVHSTPCDPKGENPFNGGPHYVRDIACVRNEGGSGCPATADTEFWSGFKSTHGGAGYGYEKIDQTARAGAQSVVLHDCLDENCEPDFTGNCPGLDGACSGKPRIACVDLVNK